MKYNLFGKTGFRVSELCFGILPMGPAQADIPVREGGDLLLQAMENGVTFFDTAQMYRTYPHLRRALDLYSGGREQIVIASKSTAPDYAGMEAAIQEALRELGRDYLDIFLLHAARVKGRLLEQRAGAWQCLLDYKEKGYLRAVGASTHNVDVVGSLAAQPLVDVIFPLYNKAGLGLVDGTAEEMLANINLAAAAGKAVYSMKLLGGGVLMDDILSALAYGRQEPAFSAHAVGMVRPKELALNLRIFNDEAIDPAEVREIKQGKSWTVQGFLCAHCGRCLETCPSYALTMGGDDIPRVDYSKCLLCGYCAAACPEFAIRIK